MLISCLNQQLKIFKNEGLIYFYVIYLYDEKNVIFDERNFAFRINLVYRIKYYKIMRKNDLLLRRYSQ